ncbi:poly(3-hydroxyalkanoate) depolymerase [Paraburkholderia ginsengiterrae]|uniref:Poly(3-hydroxyalkanoate) depolymerase n=1 Tax=Paraburkholderia ginsengiterrae TaxID=1462993 RepID=A0A1A9N8A6_9BURK|nr:poly(3-hydroxyalkanoate) depolymerase [Paraburkholderia ginsengiterrae]OAJ55118.1 poly(3-hydroxyalkanoate) depolymerase [Paraburkholderia ginsengiterrae]OAJ61303.1 poly(3-hydroxyalkanoate) depolymerase [Paraburkholderia ginsengiterrae]
MAMSPESVTSMQIQTVDLDGQLLRVAVRQGSDASPPLLIFNGIGANLELVEPFVEALEDVSVIIFDVPGVGGSPAPLVPYRFSTLSVLADKLLTRLGYDSPVDVLGVSWGGALAQQFAHLYPVRCRRLILAATSPGVIMVPARLSVLSKLIGPRRYTDPAYMQQVGADIYGGAYRRDPSLLREHSRHIQPPRGRGYLYQLLAASGWSSLPWLGGLRQRTLVLHGNDDPIVPLTNAKILAARIRDATLHVIDDGHLFLITRAKEVAPIVRRFLRQEAV